MRITIFAYTKQGGETALRIGAVLTGTNRVCIYTPEKYIQSGIEALSNEANFYEKKFDESDALIFVSAAGIALRKIAPYIKSKASDPAVIVIDELGKFVIPVLSGHLGGANNLSLFIGSALPAQPVITTATDINNIFSVDTWASEKGYGIGNIQMIKHISGRLINREEVGLFSDFPVIGGFPENIVPNKDLAYGINVSYRKNQHFANNLYVIPKCLSVGIGCRRGTDFAHIEGLFFKTIENNNIFIESIENIASIDLKKDEEGLLKLSEKYNIPIKFYSAEVLNSVQGNFSKSDFVKHITGTDNVCERAAALASEYGKIMIPKISEDGMTIGLALKGISIAFE